LQTSKPALDQRTGEESPSEGADCMTEDSGKV
jgi:hypothetical protein